VHRRRLRPITQKDGLAGDVVRVWKPSVAALDEHQYGLSRSIPQSQKIQNFPPRDGLTGQDRRLGRLLKALAREMFFGGFSGAKAFYPELDTVKTVIVQSSIDGFRLSGTRFPIGSGSPLKQPSLT